MKKLAISFLTVLLALGMMSGLALATEEDDSEDSDVSVDIAEETELDVKPASLDYSGLTPGELREASENDFTAVEVENIGSTDIVNLWARASFPESNPFGQGDATEHDAGNFLKISVPDESGLSSNSLGDFHYINRLEYEEEDEPSFIQAEVADTLETDDDPSFDVGRFRTGDREWYYTVSYDGTANTDSGACRGEGNGEVVRIANQPTTSDQIGTFNFEDDNEGDEPDNYTEYSIEETETAAYGAAESVGLYDLEEGEDTEAEDPVESYTVLTACAGDGTDYDDGEGHTVRTTRNVEFESDFDGQTRSTGDLTGFGSNDFIVDAGDDPLNPGQSFTVDLAVEAPQGVPEGSVSQGTLTMLAQADES